MLRGHGANQIHAGGVPGFWIRLGYDEVIKQHPPSPNLDIVVVASDLEIHLSTPKPGHTTGGTAHSGEADSGQRERGRAGRGAAGRGRMAVGGYAQDGGGTMPPEEKSSILPSRAPKTTFLDIFSQARTNEIFFKLDRRT